MSKKVTFKFLSKDGKTQVHGVKWIPENGEYQAILQLTHGMVEYIERYEKFAEYMTQRGFLVVGHDHIGHGESVGSTEDWGYFAKEHASDILVADMHTLRKNVQKENEGRPYFMFAHSMGSYLLRKYLTIHGEGIQGAIICGTGCVPDFLTRTGMRMCRIMARVKGWKYRSQMIADMSFSGPYKKYDLTGKQENNSWLTKDPKIVRKYYSDPKCTFLFTLNGYHTLFETVYYDNQKRHVEKIPKDLPLFVISGEDDPVGDCGKGVRKVYDALRAVNIKDVTLKLYPNDRHEILNETDKEMVYSDIHHWISKHM